MISNKSHKMLRFSWYLVPVTIFLTGIGETFDLLVKTGICRSSGSFVKQYSTVQLYCKVSTQLHWECFVVPSTLMSRHTFMSILN